MEYQSARKDIHPFVRGLMSVLSVNGAGIADAVRSGNGWIPVGIVAFGGLSASIVGIIWSLFIWVVLSCTCWILFLIVASPGSPRPYFRDTAKMCGWCMLPFSIVAFFTTLPSLIYTATFLLIAACIWMVVALGAGWSSLAGASRRRFTIAAMFGVGFTFLLQMVIWFLLLIGGLYLFG